MTPAPKRLAAIVLAAGGSSRLGQPKQLICHQGETLVQRSVSLAGQICGEVIVVLGAHASELENRLQGMDCAIVINDGWESGLASSLKVGLDRLDPSADAVLLMLCDQPLVNATDMRLLAEEWHMAPDQPVAAEFNGIVGAPAIVPQTLLHELRNRLRGDSGAGMWLRERGDLRSVSMQNAALDLDTPDDLARFGPEYKEQE